MTTKKTVAVIGGGISGMTAALILARFGHAVTLVERSPSLGMTVRGFFRQGVYFDTGLHYTGGLGPEGPLRRYLRFLGLDGLPLLPFDPDSFDTIRFAAEKREIRLCAGHEAMRARLCELFPGEERAVDEYIGEARAIFLASPFLNVGGNIRELLEAETGSGSLEAFLARRTANPLLRAVLSIHTLLQGVSPDQLSFTQHARVAAPYFEAAHTFAGGGRALVEAFERRLARSGVKTVTGTGAARVNIAFPKDAAGSAGPEGAGNALRIEGVTLDDGSVHEADTVVYTAHPHFLPDLVPPGVFKPAYARRLRSLEETPTASMLFGISDKPVLGKGRNLFLCPDANLKDFFDPERDAAQGPFFVTASPAGPGGPDGSGGCGITVLAPDGLRAYEPWLHTRSGRRGPEYAALKKEKMERFRRALTAACPELAAVRFVEGATPLTFRDFTHSPGGSLYGCKHTLTQFNPHSATRVPGLWCAGQSVIAPGVLGAVISSFLACGFILGQEQLHKELAACV
ncbi:MAG: NAD(P)/FAD-dependent oxidoreductase [Deltaproteobacteria bacterium]|jgi:all-trans-retinol 13,14-reductase|nr:NAD(P)/FAD-dependent oxidoreductase [Deltaproteobacteria bacterium]